MKSAALLFALFLSSFVVSFHDGIGDAGGFCL